MKMDEACILVCMKNRKLKTTVRKKLQKFPGVISEKLEDFTGTEPTLDPVMVIFGADDPSEVAAQRKGASDGGLGDGDAGSPCAGSP